jgi:transcriptional regulator with XRE-family HTH domain
VYDYTMQKVTSKYLRDQRTGMGLTQKQFAEFLSNRIGRKVTRDMIAQYEKDRAWVPGDMILALSHHQSQDNAA